MIRIATSNRLLLVCYLDSFAREVAACPDDDVLWRVVPGIGNSIGNLALHAAGNLQHFVGAVLGGTGYVRDREREFSARSGSRAELTAEIARAKEVVDRVLRTVSDDQWEAPFPEVVAGHRLPTWLFMSHLTGHLAHHLGQAGYLRRVLTGESTSVHPISIPHVVATLEATSSRTPA